MQAQPVVQFEQVSKRYRFRSAVKNLTFALPAGKIIGLIGTNGSGKSTTLKLMAGLVRPSQGQVKACNRPVDRYVHQSVSYMSDTTAIYPFYTSLELIEYYSKVFPDFDLRQAKDMLDFMELSPHQSSGELSKGNFGRLKLVLALSRKSPLILMDEPLSGLDPLARSSILKALLSYVDLSYQTLIMSTHEVVEIEPLIDTAMLMNDGQVIGIQDVESLRTDYGTTLLEWMAEHHRGALQ